MVHGRKHNTNTPIAEESTVLLNSVNNPKGWLGGGGGGSISEEDWIDHCVLVFNETDLHECNKTQKKKGHFA